MTISVLHQPCDHCQVGKFCKARFKQKGDHCDVKPLDVIFSDVWKADAPSLSGSKYAVDFVDQATGYIWMHYMKNKSDVPAKVKQFLDDVSGAMRGAKVKELRSDNGGEIIAVLS